MYRVSSKGNPYHDARGRFTNKDNVDEKQAVMWSSFGEQKPLDETMSSESKDQLDKASTKAHMEDGKRFYHKQSIERDKRAKALCNYTIPKGTKRSESPKLVDAMKDKFQKV